MKTYMPTSGSWVCTIRVSFPDQEIVVAQSPLGLLNWRKKEAQNLAAQLAFEMITRNDPNYQRD